MTERAKELMQKVENAKTKGELRKIETEMAVALAVTREIRQAEGDAIYKRIDERLHEGAKPKKKG